MGVPVPSHAPAVSCQAYRLPAELRNYIYELTLHLQSAQQRTSPRVDVQPGLACASTFGFHLRHDYKPPPVLGVNRQTRIKASKSFYTRTRFFRYSHFTRSHLMSNWLHSLQSVDRRLVKSFKYDPVDLGLTIFPSLTQVEEALAGEDVARCDFIERLEVAVEDENAEGGWRYMKVQDILDS